MLEQLKLLIRAGNPLLCIETLDERRACLLVRKAVEDLGLPLLEWSVTEGLTSILPTADDVIARTNQPQQALDFLLQKHRFDVAIFKDLGPHCRDAVVQRRLRDWCRRERSTLIAVEIEPLAHPVRRWATPLRLPLPEPEELVDVVRQTIKRVSTSSLVKIPASVSRQDVEHIVHVLRGLTTAEAERLVAEAIHFDYALTPEDLPRIIEGKRNLLAGSGSLEALTPDVGPGDVGGLDNLKKWLKARRHAASPKARAFGIRPPRGILLLGVQGCGKSLSAKVVAADWHLPLLRLDPGVLYDKYVGETENHLRQALDQAEAMAPVVLWIDEIEKAFASASAASADGGLSQRMFGTLLTWMQDHRSPIFLVATANNVSALPPELLRKGRFDEVFFIDLPHDKSRRAIWIVQLRRHKRDPAKFDLERLIAASDGYSGAEIEQVIHSALCTAFSRNREMTNEDLLAELKATRPLSILMAEKVAELRAWAADRCVPAD